MNIIYKAIMKVLRPDPKQKESDVLEKASEDFYSNDNFKQLIKDLDLELDDVNIMDKKEK